MYIVFDLPLNVGLFIGPYILDLKEQLRIWAEKYQIEITRTKRVRDTVRVFLKDQRYYEFFALTWNPEISDDHTVHSEMTKAYMKEFRFVDPDRRIHLTRAVD